MPVRFRAPVWARRSSSHGRAPSGASACWLWRPSRWRRSWRRAAPGRRRSDYGQRIEAAKRGLAEDPAIEARDGRGRGGPGPRAGRGDDRRDRAAPRRGVRQRLSTGCGVLARIPGQEPRESFARAGRCCGPTPRWRSPGSRRPRSSAAPSCAFPRWTCWSTEGACRSTSVYATRQEALLEWSEDWRSAGTIDELAAARFEIESRIKLATREPARPPQVEVVMPVLPEIGARPTGLVRARPLLRETVRSHHPSAAVRRATAERYRALSDRADSEARPWLKFVDVSYQYESGGGGEPRSRRPAGLRDSPRARASGPTRAAIGRSFARSRAKSSTWWRSRYAAAWRPSASSPTSRPAPSSGRSCEALARAAEQIADRWWRDRLARPSQVAALLDQAFAARSAVLDARERAAIAGCTLLAMTGVPPESWPRQ